MRCPYCAYEESKVIDKRETGENQEITRRRRECLKCNRRFTTYETVEDTNIMIVKKDGRRESFDRNKLLSGIKRACEKRPVSTEDIEKMMAEIESELRGRNSSEIPSSVVGEIVMKKLEETDKIAYIRFASVYREFTDLKSFSEELTKLLSKKR
ncbi:MAG: transcriptional regulator NrdR [Candidatus Woesearchaeota archaeon]